MNLSRTTVRNYEVRLSVEHGRVIVEPATTIANLTLADRLNLFDPALHGDASGLGAKTGRKSYGSTAVLMP
ncbi:hypothetical protein OW565_01525, partial [Acidithiobacillus ferriphilus]|nr:hypothetical protein [Acidithiobacillus ferriphilus]